jgi:hypothetical protein
MIYFNEISRLLVTICENPGTVSLWKWKNTHTKFFRSQKCVLEEFFASEEDFMLAGLKSPLLASGHMIEDLLEGSRKRSWAFTVINQIQKGAKSVVLKICSIGSWHEIGCFFNTAAILCVELSLWKVILGRESDRTRRRSDRVEVSLSYCPTNE